MKYYCVSDIHGSYYKLIDALKLNNFNKEKDTIIVVGDIFDRGHYVKETLEYILSCPNRILIWGNHDLRIRDIYNYYKNDKKLDKGWLTKSDIYNGVIFTFLSLTNYLLAGENLEEMLIQFTHLKKYEKQRELLERYFNECVFMVEFNDLYIAHGWFPFKELTDNKFILLDNPSYEDYVNSTWANSMKLFENKVLPNKPLLIGHWGTYHFNNDINNNNIFNWNNQFIAIDGTTALEDGKVNVYIKDTNDIPKKHY